MSGLERLQPADRQRVTMLLAEVEAHDGVAPLSEEHLLALAGPAPDVQVARGGEEMIVGLLSRVATSAELAVHPHHRRRGHGTRLTTAALPGPIWAHGDLPAARGLAAARGLVRSRELLRLERPSAPGDRDVPRRADVVVLGDLPLAEREDALRAWLDLNATAFADHPEQGAWTWQDVRARLAEPWFDPALLFLVPDPERPGRLRASAWLKPQDPAADGRERLEVYVLAVHPEAAGAGLGGSLLKHVLAVAAERGVGVSELYVDGGNAPAVRLYERAGYDVVERHAQYTAAG